MEETKRQLDEIRKQMDKATPDQLRKLCYAANEDVINRHFAGDKDVDSELRRKLIMAAHDLMICDNLLIDLIEKYRR